MHFSWSWFLENLDSLLSKLGPLKVYLRDTAKFIFRHCSKAKVAIEQVKWIFWFSGHVQVRFILTVVHLKACKSMSEPMCKLKKKTYKMLSSEFSASLNHHNQYTGIGCLGEMAPWGVENPCRTFDSPQN